MCLPSKKGKIHGSQGKGRKQKISNIKQIISRNSKEYRELSKQNSQNVKVGNQKIDSNFSSRKLSKPKEASKQKSQNAKAGKRGKSNKARSQRSQNIKAGSPNVDPSASPRKRRNTKDRIEFSIPRANFSR